MSTRFSSATSSIEHPIIGTVKGKSSDGVIQFLGLRYATLRHWLDMPRMSIYDSTGVAALHHGPQAISPVEALDNEFLAIQKGLPKPEFPGISTTDCLNLNISVPDNANESSSLPVLVYVHGGGFSVGSNWWPQFDMAGIVKRSISLGKPIIGININYRLGAPGFMCSEELRQAGYGPNRGLQDQVTALEWVQAYIKGFGGDAARVMVVGESAGGLSAARLSFQEQSLASRIVVMGGAPPSIKPLDPQVAEATYNSFIQGVGIANLNSEERLAAIEDMKVDDLQRILPSLNPFLPVLDGDLVPYSESFDLLYTDKSIYKSKTCEAALVVYSTMDASIFAFMGLFSARKKLANAFCENVHSVLVHEELAARLLKTYGISPELADGLALTKILQFGTDIGNEAASKAFVQGFPGDALLLEFSEPNPWDGPFKGYSTHILDVAFLLQNYNHHLDEKQRSGAMKFAEDVITFAHGEDPWEPYRATKNTAVLREGSRTLKYEGQPGAKRFDELMAIGEEVGLDTLLAIWHATLFGNQAQL